MAPYTSVKWDRHKLTYDLVVGGCVALHLATFILVATATGRPSANSNPEVLLISALGACAFLMLHVILAIGPLARLSPVFLPLLYNRRHLGVMFFVIALAHATLATIWYHGDGVLNPIVSLFVSNPRYDAIDGFPFESLGAVAIVIFFILAATSHDFWLRTLSPAVWKTLHMLIYIAYTLVVLHVLRGAASGHGGGMTYVWATAAGFAIVAGLHIATGVLQFVRDNRSVRPERPSARDFYAGYGAMPPRLKWIVRGLALLLFVLVALDAWLIARLQPAAGEGTASEVAQDYVGTLTRTPYPMLRVNTPDGLKTYLLVSDEKRGAEAVLGVTPNGPVKLSGFPITRAGVGMIELAADAVAVISETPAIEEPAREVHGTGTMEGEIVDSKCWLGAMRPGEGHLHKSCASLCIRGGIPPMFVMRSEQGVAGALLLTQADGTAAPPDLILAYVGDAVRVSGTIERRGDLWVLKADLPTLTRPH